MVFFMTPITSSSLINLSHYKAVPLKKAEESYVKRFPLPAALSSGSAMVSVISFFGGGGMLLLDSFLGRFSRKNNTSSQHRKNHSLYQPLQPFRPEGMLSMRTPASRPVTGSFSRLLPPLQSPYYPQHTQQPLRFSGTSQPGQSPDPKKDTDSVLQGFSPETPLGKVGLALGRIGVGTSGISGMLNGWRLNLPLMTLGEAGVAGSSPWTETPAGLGLFNFGLGAMFSARALELDIQKRLNPQVLQSKKGLNKVAYIAKNVSGTFGSLINSSKLTARHATNLLRSGQAHQQAMNFFKYEFLNFRNNSVLLTEKITHSGKPILQMTMKDSPHFMNTASLLLMFGGATLAVGSAIKNKLTQQVGFRSAAVGGSLDNISLAKQGITRMHTPGMKASGPVYTIAGLTILPGQQWANKQWGRALMWTATGFLFTAISIDSWKQLAGELAKRKEPLREVATSAVRQWEINLSNLLNNKKLFPSNNVFARDKSRDGIKHLIEAVNISGQGSMYPEALAALKQAATTLDSSAIEKLDQSITQAFSTGKKEAVQKAFSEFEQGGTRMLNIKESAAYDKFKAAVQGGAGEYALKLQALRDHSKGGEAIVEAIQHAHKTINTYPAHTPENWSERANRAMEQALNKDLKAGLKITPYGDPVSRVDFEDRLKEIRAVNEDQFSSATLKDTYAKKSPATPSASV